MNLDELRSVRDRERQTDSLQDLRASFYADAREYIREMRVERERAVESADDPFGSPEVRRLTDDIETAEQTLEDIYERRVGKVVEKASFAAADMPTDDGELTAEEHRLFETLVGDIRENRELVLSTTAAADGATDDGTTDDGTTDDASAPVPDAEPEIDAADLMGDSDAGGGGTDPTAPELEPEPEAEAEPEAKAEAEPEAKAEAEPEAKAEPEPEAKVHAQAESGTTGAGPTEADVQRATVRVTEDVGEILGVDQRAYHLASEDVVTLPATNAAPLVERGAAERID